MASTVTQRFGHEVLSLKILPWWAHTGLGTLICFTQISRNLTRAPTPKIIIFLMFPKLFNEFSRFWGDALAFHTAVMQVTRLREREPQPTQRHLRHLLGPRGVGTLSRPPKALINLKTLCSDEHVREFEHCALGFLRII